MKKSVFAFVIIISINLTVRAQDITSLDENEKNIIIDTIITCFKNNYVYPEVAVSVADSINRRNNKGDYSEFINTNDLLDKLSADITRITQDVHTGINYIENSDRDAGQYKHSILSQPLERKEKSNFSFRVAEWLPGNIGYIRFDRFEDPGIAGDIATAALNLITNCDAIIIDLRYNYGGEAGMVTYLSSYFFSDPTLLNSLYFTRQDSMVQSWTNTYIPGKRLTDKDVYILTGHNTASGAESFTYTMASYKKAVIVGEKTRGAAHWVEYFYYPSIKAEIKLPIAKPVNPITKSDWEKTGITPDVIVPGYMAYYKAYYMALEVLQNKCIDESRSDEFDWYKNLVSEKLKNEMISTSDLTEYTGEYEGLSFLLKDNSLFWHQEDNAEFILLPVSKDHFVFDDSDDYIVRFVRNAKKKITGYQLLIRNRDVNPIHNKTN